jgi:SAM-dependent methyltransferase
MAASIQSPLTQNIYDTPEFFSAYSALPRSVQGLGGAPEWASLRELLPSSLKGKHVLDLGCGMGWFCRWAASSSTSADGNADKVIGIDVSDNMLARATEFDKEKTSKGGNSVLSYRQADLETLELSETAFDVVFSSLTFHYLSNLRELVKEVYNSLKPGGVFVFSVEHPTMTAPKKAGVGINSGWTVDADGNKESWPLESYLLEGKRTTNWMASEVVKQHRTTATYVNLLIEAGFVFERLIEWGPSEEQLRVNPSWNVELMRPTFMLLKATK